MEFTYNNTDIVGVTAQRIPAASGNDVKVWYTTNKAGEREYLEKLTSENSSVLFTAKLAGLQEGEYFTSIRAEVGSYDADYLGYVESRTADPSSGCATTFGKLLYNVGGAGHTKFATMKMYDTQDGSVTAPNTSFDVQFYTSGSNKEAAIAMLNGVDADGGKIPVLSTQSATAGGKVQFNGVLANTGYPYSLYKVVSDAGIYIRLPKSITIEDLKLSRITGGTADRLLLGDFAPEMATAEEIKTILLAEGTDYKITERTEDNGNYAVYKISFLSNNGTIGWYTENLGQTQIGLSFVMDIDPTAEAMTLDMRDCVRVGSASLSFEMAVGTLREYCQKDTNDVDGDGNKTENFTTFSINAVDTKLSVVAARLGLTFGFGAKMSESDSTGTGDEG